ncbi:MAG: NAD(P)H-dependent oxidoreductase [Fusobacteriota bacterium]
MKLIVLNGSPKGQKSVTMQYINFLKKVYPKVDFEILDISQNIKKIENDKEYFENILESIRKSQGVIWAYPVYHFLIPAQMKRFIEIIFEEEKEECFKEKYTTVISTSINFFDTTAQEYMSGITQDLEMKYIKGFLANMNDLLEDEKKNILKIFMEDFLKRIKFKTLVTRDKYPIKYNESKYEPELKKIQSKNEKKDKNILLITDVTEKDKNLENMVIKLKESLSMNIKEINLNNYDLKNGCLGCIKCGYNGQCVYDDEISDVYTKDFKWADGLIIAGKIKDRYFSSTMKKFWDRSFVNGHRPILAEKQTLYLVSGPFRQIPIIKEEIKARSQVGKINLVDIISDDMGDSKYLDKLLEESAKRFEKSILDNKKELQNFFGVAGHKIFRDFIYKSRGVFKKDHKYYKKIKYYDFPQKSKLSVMLSSLLGIGLNIPQFREEFQKRIKDGMISNLKKEVEKY